MTWTSFVNWLKANIYAGAFFLSSAALLAVAITLALANHDRKELRTEVATVSKSLDQCKIDKDRIVADLDTQKLAVDALKADGVRRAAEANRAIQAAQGAATSAKKTAAALLARRGTGNLCVSAEAVLRGKEG